MNSFFNFQFGEFNGSSPNWFDWFSVILNTTVSAASIFLAFYLAERIYKKEKKDKEKEDDSILNSETLLFKNSLTELNTAIKSQVSDLKEYTERRDFSLKFHQDVQVDFLQFIDVKFLYKKEGLENSESIKNINRLLSSLYTLYDFRDSLRNELRTYIKKYNYHESKFYIYRQLLYTKYYDLCNRRATSFTISKGEKKWTFDNDDNFMKLYSELISKTHRDKSIFTENGLNRDNLIAKFILPLLKMSFTFIPEDPDAIQINDIGNEVNSAFGDMTTVTEKHFTAIRSYLSNLETISLKIEQYLTPAT